MLILSSLPRHLIENSKKINIKRIEHQNIRHTIQMNTKFKNNTKYDQFTLPTSTKNVNDQT